MTLGGKFFSAEEAKAFGLVDEAFEKRALQSNALSVPGTCQAPFGSTIAVGHFGVAFDGHG